MLAGELSLVQEQRLPVIGLVVALAQDPGQSLSRQREPILGCGCVAVESAATVLLIGYEWGEMKDGREDQEPPARGLGCVDIMKSPLHARSLTRHQNLAESSNGHTCGHTKGAKP